MNDASQAVKQLKRTLRLQANDQRKQWWTRPHGEDGTGGGGKAQVIDIVDRKIDNLLTSNRFKRAVEAIVKAMPKAG